jgi:hypothetical protein
MQSDLHIAATTPAVKDRSFFKASVHSVNKEAVVLTKAVLEVFALMTQ